MKRFWTFILIALAIFVFASWQYRLLCCLAVVIINCKSLKLRLNNKWKHTYLCLITILIVGIYHNLPNYFQRGRTQVAYFDKNGQYMRPPLGIYIGNCLIPEKEAMNLCLKFTGIIIPILNHFSSSHDYAIKTSHTRIGGTLIKEAIQDYWSMKRLDYYAPYYRLNLDGSHPGSIAAAQFFNTVSGTNYESIYITTPKYYNTKKKYPVVFFCHGYLGNWELYQGILSRLDNCFVISIGSKDISGIFHYKDIKNIFNKYIPYLKQEGYSIDEHQLHLIGLSNGGSAANIAFNSCDKKFNTITYLSTGCSVIKHSPSTVLFIGGGKDKSMYVPISRLRSCGTMVDSYIEPNDGHYMLIHRKRKVIDFLHNKYNCTHPH